MATTKPLYLKVLKQAWKFTWHHPILWVFGLFAILLGHTGVLEITASIVDLVTGNAVSSALPASPVTAIVVPTVFGSQLLGLAGQGMFILILLGIAVLVLVAAVASSGALIHAAHKYKGKSESLRESWHHGVIHFWPLFWINVGKKALLVLLLWIIALPLTQIITGGNTALLSTLFILVFIAGLTLAVVISFLANYASMYVVLHNEHVGNAIMDAWKLFRSNVLVSIEMALVLVVVQAVTVVVSLVGFAVFYLPFFMFYIAAISLGASILVPIGGVIALGGGILFVVFVDSLYSTFAVSAWTILYMQLKTKRNVKGFLSRVASFSLLK